MNKYFYLIVGLASIFLLFGLLVTQQPLKGFKSAGASLSYRPKVENGNQVHPESKLNMTLANISQWVSGDEGARAVSISNVNSISSDPITPSKFKPKIIIGTHYNNYSGLPHLSPATFQAKPEVTDTNSGVSVFTDSYLGVMEINEQLSSNTVKILQLSYFSALWNLSIVEPFIASDTCHLSTFPHAGKKDMLFFDLFNKTRIERQLTECFSTYLPKTSKKQIHFHSLNDALIHSSRDVLIIQFMTSRWSNTKRIGECGAISKKKALTVLTALNSHVQNVKEEAQKIHGHNINFKLWRAVCITAIPRVPFSVRDATAFIQSQLAAKRKQSNIGATVVIPKWMKVKNTTSGIYYYDPTAKFSLYPCKTQNLPYSDLVFTAAQRMLNALQIQYPFIGLYVRTELLAMKGSSEIKTCVNRFHTTFQMIIKRYGIPQSQVVLIHDANRYGSKTFSRNSSERSKSILESLKSWKLRVVSYDPQKHKDLPQHRAFVAAVEQVFLSHSHVLLAMGGGGFMQNVVGHFSVRQASDRAYQICL